MDLKNKLRHVQDFPKEGVDFIDITTILSDKDAYKQAIDEMCEKVAHLDFDVIVGSESRGFMFAATLHTHAEGFAFQRLAPQRQRLFKNIVQRGERYVFDFQNMVDAGDTGQRIANSRALIFIFRANFDMIPMTDDGQRLVIVFENVTNVPG